MNIKKQKWISLILGISAFVLFAGCAPKPIKIGLSVELTGARGELGVMTRNGAKLAVDEINAAGGVAGRPIVLLIRDDQGDLDQAQQMDTTLIDEGVVAIVGHITSGQTAAVIDLINQREVVLISGSASSSQFSALDDYFFRTTASTDQTGNAFADYLFDLRGIQQISFIYDARNSIFSLPFVESMTNRFLENGGVVNESISFTSGESDLVELAANLNLDSNYVIIASAVDTALITQYVDQEDFQGEIFTSSWAATNKLVETGGETIEGMQFITAFNPDTTWPEYQPFIDRYLTRYGEEPGILAPKAYDIIYILAASLEQTGGSAQGLREALLGTRDFNGVDGQISLDQYGDAVVDLYIAQVVSGQFETIETLSISKND